MGTVTSLTGGAVLQLSNKKSSRVGDSSEVQPTDQTDKSITTRQLQRSSEQVRIREVLGQVWAHL